MTSADHNPRTTITALVLGKSVHLPIDQVAYFKTDCKYTVAHHQGGELLLSEPLKVLEEELAGRFIRIHRSTLVPLDRLVEIKRCGETRGYFLTLAGVSEQLSVARRYINIVRQAIAERRTAA